MKAGEISSQKWITTETKSGERVLVAHNVDHAFAGLRASPCNLISIFGKAREGKSFLMNCLAGEDQIFKISNEKESCTQGIDISNKWMTVTQFSELHGGTACKSDTKVGFVDAEGQGDRDVSYDANLVCPILLASKCIIFNWKGGLQKDSILSTLGIMTRAAKNVSLSEDELASGKSTFGHLHIVFRDWQSVGTDADSVHKDIFNLERTADGTVRDQIRKDVLKSFESVNIWLLDAPSDLTSILRTKMTLSICAPAFKSQVQSLRKVLSAQLTSPALFAGQIMTARTLTKLVSLVVDSLNKGQAILPRSTYVSMMTSEITQLRAKLSDDMRRACTFELGASPVGLDFRRLPTALSLFQEKQEVLVNEYLLAAADAVGSNRGEIWAAVMSDSPSFVASLKADTAKLFTSEYENLFNTWLREATQVVQDAFKAGIADMKNKKWSVSAAQLNAEIEVLSKSCLSKFNEKKHEGEAMNAALEKLHTFMELETLKMLELNTKKAVAEQQNVQDVVQRAVTKMRSVVDSEVLKLSRATDRGYPREALENHLNTEYFKLEAEIQDSIQGSAHVDSMKAAFEKECKALHESLCVSYNNALVKAYSEAVSKTSKALRAAFPSEHSPETMAIWMDDMSSIINDTKSGLSGWTATLLDQRKYLDPITEEGKTLTNELLKLTELAAAQKRKREDEEIQAEQNRLKAEREAEIERKMQERIKREREEEENERKMQERIKREREEEENERKRQHDRMMREREEAEMKERIELEQMRREREMYEEEEASRLAEIERQKDLSQRSATLEEQTRARRNVKEEESDDEDAMDLVDCAPDGAVKGTRRRQSGEAENAKVVEQRRLAAQWAKDNLGVKPGKTAERKQKAPKAAGLSAVDIARSEAKADLELKLLNFKRKK